MAINDSRYCNYILFIKLETIGMSSFQSTRTWHQFIYHFTLKHNNVPNKKPQQSHYLRKALHKET